MHQYILFYLKPNDNFIQELGIVLRSMGQNPSEFELKEMIREMDEDGSGTVDFQVYIILI